MGNQQPVTSVSSASNSSSSPSPSPSPSVGRVEVSAEQARLDSSQHSDEPLFVVYGRPSCMFCVKAVELLEKKELHHCKIGTEKLQEAIVGSGAPFSGTIPQVSRIIEQVDTIIVLWGDYRPSKTS